MVCAYTAAEHRSYKYIPHIIYERCIRRMLYTRCSYVCTCTPASSIYQTYFLLAQNQDLDQNLRSCSTQAIYAGIHVRTFVHTYAQQLLCSNMFKSYITTN